MARKKIREYDAKRLLFWHLKRLKGINIPIQVAQVRYGGPSLIAQAQSTQSSGDDETNLANGVDKQQNGFSEILDVFDTDTSWLNSKRLVVKPDMLFGKRGKSNLVKLDLSLTEASSFIESHLGTELEIEGVKGRLNCF
eukprot:jgi/Galph1/1433/GphlegSOOS_G122.1